MGKATAPRKPKLTVVPQVDATIQRQVDRITATRVLANPSAHPEENDLDNGEPVTSPSADVDASGTGKKDCVITELPLLNDSLDLDVEGDIHPDDRINPGPSWDTRDPTRTGADEEFRVMLMKDHSLVYPDLFLEVHVAGSRYEEAQFAEMLVRSRCMRARDLAHADLVIFTGGPDVDPALYGEKPHRKTHSFKERDDEDIKLYMYCMENGIPMFGVCRGAQFLHVMNGGKLYQDIDNHHGDHMMWDVQSGKMIEKVSSIHHQACIFNHEIGMTLLATNSGAKERWKNPEFCVRGTQADVEAFFYRETCCIGVQGHPEYRGYNFFSKWCCDLIEKYVILNPDIDWKGGSRRMKQDLMQQRGTGKLLLPSSLKEKK